MIPVEVKTLIMFSHPAPAALVLAPIEEGGALAETPGVHRVLPIWVGMAEAAGLSYALEARKAARPLTHDLLLDMVSSLDAHIARVVIDRVEKKTFSCTIYLSQYGREISVDARPSDAIALAIRQNSPIFIEDEILEMASFPYIVRNAQAEEQELNLFHQFLETIEPEDFDSDTSLL